MRKFTARFAFVFVLGLATLAAAKEQSAPASELDASAAAPVQEAKAVLASETDVFAAQIPELDPKSGGLASLVAAVALAIVARRVTPLFAGKHG